MSLIFNDFNFDNFDICNNPSSLILLQVLQLREVILVMDPISAMASSVIDEFEILRYLIFLRNEIPFTPSSFLMHTVRSLRL
jgi:hypothetical protein